MFKFVSILVTVVALNFMVSFAPTQAENQSDEVALLFSEDAIAIESGQPVFSRATKIWLSNPTGQEMQLYLNESEKNIRAEKIELSQLTELKEGTYTLVVKTGEEETIFGFTLK